MKPARKLLLLSGPVAILAYCLSGSPHSVDHSLTPQSQITVNTPNPRSLTKPTAASSPHYPQPSSGTPTHSQARPASRRPPPGGEDSINPALLVEAPVLPPNPTRPSPEQLPPPPTLRPIRPPAPLPWTPAPIADNAQSSPRPEPSPQHGDSPPDINSAQADQPIVELELPPQSQLPAVLANPAPAGIPVASAEKNAPSQANAHLRPNAASVAEDSIIHDFLTEANPPVSPGETTADHDAIWDAAARLADERYRSLAGKEAYLKRSLDAGRLSKQLPATND
ncbi:MAG: hypothetical protein JWL81_3188 [Verrucomicrobiales bacterium]|nr:hypothetical protein [Verrucomicrobiales bacterium]